MANRDEKKKQRRQKRRQKREKYQRPAPELPSALSVLREVERAIKVPPPASFPGGRDPSLARPDQIKYDLAMSATEHEPGKSKLRRMKDAADRGELGNLVEVDHWIMEEFLWHGLPGDTWQPVDAFLAGAGAGYPPAAAEQLRLWKAAEIGIYEIGEVRDDTVTLQAWDSIQQTHSGRPLRAISLNIGGVNSYRNAAGALTLTYLAPWAAADNLYCAMGYGKTVAKRDVAMLLLYLGLRHPDVICQPLPWKLHRPAADEHLRKWRQRDWHRWLGEQLRFPFWAIVATPPDEHLEVRQVTELIPATPEHIQRYGIYLLVPREEGNLAAGCTMVEPIDITSPNTLTLAEYRAYRDRVGPPPGAGDMPPFTTLR